MMGLDRSNIGELLCMYEHDTYGKWFTGDLRATRLVIAFKCRIRREGISTLHRHNIVGYDSKVEKCGFIATLDQISINTSDTILAARRGMAPMRCSQDAWSTDATQDAWSADATLRRRRMRGYFGKMAIGSGGSKGLARSLTRFGHPLEQRGASRGSL
jgi:hypothetical protein